MIATTVPPFPVSAERNADRLPQETVAETIMEGNLGQVMAVKAVTGLTTYYAVNRMATTNKKGGHRDARHPQRRDRRRCRPQPQNSWQIVVGSQLLRPTNVLACCNSGRGLLASPGAIFNSCW
jgi:hypothetical protein